MIKLHENFKPKYNTIVDNLKREVAEWSDENSEIFESVVASVITGTPIYDVGQEEVDYTNKYKKETLKASLQNYVLNQLNYGVDNIPLFFIFELEGFGKFDYSDFVGSLSNYTLEVISNNLKKYFEEFLEFDYHSYTLNTTIEAINDPMEYGELIKLTATISIKMD
jgi:hypothetical protein